MGISLKQSNFFKIEPPFTKIDIPWTYGTEDADVIYSDADPDDDIYFSIIYGLSGSDELYGGDRVDELYGGIGPDKLYGGEEGDYLYGGDQRDTLFGGRGDDHLFGGDGRDILEGGRGNDYLDGGDGEDTASYASSGNGVMVDLAAGRGYMGAAYGDTLISIENVLGSNHRDYIWGDDNANRIEGAGGDDQLFGYGGEDILYGGAGDDLIFGGDGNDQLSGSAGADTLYGDAGIDTVFYHAAVPTTSLTVDLSGTGIGGEAQGDRYNSVEGASVEGGSNHLLLGDGLNNELSVGGNLGSTLRGLGGEDQFILAWSGGNTIEGGSGEDTLIYYNGRDTDIDLNNGWSRQSGYSSDTVSGIENVTTSSGHDEIYGSNIGNILRADFGNDEVYGRDGNDFLYGENGNDRLDGGRHNDALFGGIGNDRLNGNDGDDILTGGEDADIFVFITDRDDNDRDIVTDFEVGVDRLDLDDTIIDDFGEYRDRATQVGANTVIDTGDGTITLEGINMLDLTNADFIF